MRRVSLENMYLSQALAFKICQKTYFFWSHSFFFVLEGIKKNPKQFKPYELLWLHSLVFALEF